MPTGPINIQPNSISFKPPIKMTQNIEESLSITSFCLNHTIASEQRINPTRDIQTDTMLACRRNLQTFPFLRPTTTQSRVHRESCLILEDDGFIRLKGLKFFLKPSEISVLLGSVLEDTSNLPALDDIQDGASIVGLVVPSCLFQRNALDESLTLAHPTVRGLIQIPLETSPNVLQVLFGLSALTVKFFLLWAWVSRTLCHLCLLRESNDLGSFGLIRIPRLSIQGVVLPALKEGRLSLCQSMRLVFDRLLPIIVLYWRLYALNLMWGFSCPQYNEHSLHCHFI